ncbi:hypothetical protein VNO80_16562 [Phaseolus coccineus]|uniref:Uncharacterized protein n=1 Tax=Phaseolus coccineus TaxID=3886 RepID=A0AAN9MTI6_PHACN
MNEAFQSLIRVTQRDQLKRAGGSQKIGFFYKAKSLGAKLEHACSAAFRTPSYVTTPMFEEVQVFVLLNEHRGPTLLLQKGKYADLGWYGIFCGPALKLFSFLPQDSL